MFAVLPPPPYQPAPTAMPKFMHFRTVKNVQRERKSKHIFRFWGNNYLNKAPKKNAEEENEKITLERRERQNV